MFYLNALGAMLALLWAWALKDDPPAEDPPEDDPPEDPPEKPEGKFTQDDVDRIVSERLERERRSQETKREEAERKAREKALEEQGEHKAIAEQRQETIVKKDATIAERDARIIELEGQVEALGTHRKANEERAAALMENVPESVKELLADRDPLKQLEWLDKNPELAGLKTNGDRPRGSREIGRPSRTNNDKPDDEAQKRQRQRTASAF